MKILSSQWMRALDFRAINEAGIPSVVLMEKASLSVAEICRSEFPPGSFPKAVIFAGPGNNGGDGLAAGRILAGWGYEPFFLFLSDPDELKGDAALNFRIIKNLGLKYSKIENESGFKTIVEKYSPRDTFFIDAIFGTGMKKPVTGGLYYEIIKGINGSGFRTISIDMPSGLSDLYPPKDGIYVNPLMTVTFQALKTALLFPDDKKRCGRIHIRDIGIPAAYLQDEKYYIRLSSPEDFSGLFRERESGLHKGKLGHVLVIAGSEEKPGAAVLSSISVLRSGAGLSTCCAPESCRDLIIKHYPEIMTLSDEHFKNAEDIPPEYTTILAGPGLGDHMKTEEIVRTILKISKVPLILDADALNIIEKIPDILTRKRSAPLILTPHPKEFSRISGTGIEEIINDPVNSARDFSMKHGLYTVLKGHYSVIATPAGKIIVNQSGNPGMATAGSGDILGGMIAGMIAQHRERFPMELILQAAVFVHGYAGDIAAEKKGEISITASDILEVLPDAFLRADEYRSEFQFC